MSAETPRRSRSQGATVTTTTPVVASPQQVNDRSIIDSVAGFINEVVPTAYSTPADTKDQIQWLHFEYLDRNQSEFIEAISCDNGIPTPLVVVLGYGSGIQVWAVPASGDAIEVLAWRHGAVRVLRILPNPSSSLYEEKPDLFSDKRPLMVLCDTATPGPQYYSLSFISLKTGAQVKNIKFKNPVLDVVANKRSVVVTFAERIAIFDAHTLEDRLTVTTCFLSPGLYPNPIALGTRWLAYAEKKLIPTRRSGGGNEGEGVQSYAATVLHAAKSLGKGLRELGETVASSLSGTSTGSTQHISNSGNTDILQPGIVTILDLQCVDCGGTDRGFPVESVVAHFTAHSEAIVCMQFDPSGMLFLTADKRGHDFHMFRIQPHPGGPSLAAVHHLYTLHRGDTSARVQDICFSPDSRWVAVSTLRGTTHVFPVTPYGGAVGMRTHATPHVVNRMSRFHRSAGLPVEGRSHSPISQLDFPVQAGIPYRNPRLPPYPHPTVVHPLAQLRQPLLLPLSGASITQRSSAGRTRLGSSSEDTTYVALRVAACFAPPRAWLDTPNQTRDPAHKQRRPVESLFVISCHGTLIQYDLEPRHSVSIPKERVCDDTAVELKVTAHAQWALQRQGNSSDLQAPLPPDNILLCMAEDSASLKGHKQITDYSEDRWLSQVEIITHAGPHRRLWMGPQFTFKTYNGTNGSPVSVLETEITDVTSIIRPARSNPLNMPDDGVPVLIESGSASSFEQSPRLLDRDMPGSSGESRLREDLADAMLESPGRIRDQGGRCVLVSIKHNAHIVAKVVNPLGTVVTVPNDHEEPCGGEPPEDTVIHENCDEALFRPVVGVRPISCLQPEANYITNDRNQRYQGLKSDEIVHDVHEEIPEKTTGKKNKKSKNKQDSKTTVKTEQTVVEQLPVKELCNSLEKILFSEDKDENREMWSSVEKLLPEHAVQTAVEDPAKEMWSSVEHCKLEESTFAEVEPKAAVLSEVRKTEKSDDDFNPNNNSSETTESDDSAKNKALVSVAADYPAEDNTACDMPIISAQSVQKTSKKKAKKKRK